MMQMIKRDVTRRGLLQDLSLIGGASVLAACGAGGAAPAAPAVDQGAARAALGGRNVELWGATGGAFADDLRKELETSAARVGVGVEYVVIPGGWAGMTEKLNAAVAADAVPDVAGIKDFSMKQYAVKGNALRLDRYLGAGAIEGKKFRKSVWEAMLYRGVPYGAPWPGSFVHVLFLNNELFAQAGLDPAKPPATWRELTEVSQKLTNTGNGQWGHGLYELGTREYNLMLFSIYTGQAGGTVFSDDLSRVTLTTAPAQEAMTWMHDLLWTRGAAVPADQMGNKGNLILSGKVATWNAGPWSIWEYRQKAPQLNWSIAQWPCHKTCDNVDAPECLVILKGARAPDASWLAMKFLLSPELDLRLAGPRGALPAYEENLDQGIFASDPAFKAYAQIGRGTALRPRTFVDGYEDVAAAITPDLLAVWLNQKSIKDGLAAAERAGNEALGRVRGERR